MSVSEEDLEDLSRLLDLDERKPVLLARVRRRESEDVVEDGGDGSKAESSSGEEDFVRRLHDEVCAVVELEDGRVGGVEDGGGGAGSGRSWGHVGG